jgi:hypothetical protein
MFDEGQEAGKQEGREGMRHEGINNSPSKSEKMPHGLMPFPRRMRGASTNHRDCASE